MNLWLRLYLLVSVASAFGLFVHCLRAKGVLRSGLELKIHAALALLSLLLPFVPSPFSAEFKFEPVVKKMAAKTYREFEAYYPRGGTGPMAAAAVKESPQEWPWEILLVGLLVIPARDLFRLRRALRSATPWRRIGHVRIAFGPSAFSARWAGTAWVVLPSALIGDRLALRMVLSHELEHHRGRDTLWLYLFFVLRALTPFHPLRRYWCDAVERAQEERCDESLVDQGRVEKGVYARFLLMMAETAKGEGSRVACAANFFPFSDRNTLMRRIEYMWKPKKQNKWMAGALALLMGAGLVGTAFATSALAVDHRITLADAERMAERARAGTEFPIVVNDLVVRQLNKYLGTEQGRKFVRESVARMRELSPMLEQKREEYGTPEEILAVAMAESGFYNYPESANPNHSAGIWQFIPSTARNYGLRVDHELDERMVPERATDAAFRYLKSNRLRFSNWWLGIMAYNIGEQTVNNAIEQHGTRNAWELIRKGVRTDSDYLPKVAAFTIILKNPDSLQ